MNQSVVFWSRETRNNSIAAQLPGNPLPVAGSTIPKSKTRFSCRVVSAERMPLSKNAPTKQQSLLSVFPTPSQIIPMGCWWNKQSTLESLYSTRTREDVAFAFRLGREIVKHTTEINRLKSMCAHRKGPARKFPTGDCAAKSIFRKQVWCGGRLAATATAWRPVIAPNVLVCLCVVLVSEFVSASGASQCGIIK